MLKQRVLTACVLVLVLLPALLLLPESGFQVLVAVLLSLAAWEWSHLAGLRQPWSRSLPVLLLLPLLYLAGLLSAGLLPWLFLASLLWWLLALLLVLRYPRHSETWDRCPVLLSMGVAILLPGWLGLVVLRQHEQYRFLILLLLALVAAADIGAYFAGRAFGRHKLAPAVSPNKTWEGVVGGLLLSCLVLWLFLAGATVAGNGPGSGQWIVATLGTLLLAASSVLGDLFESMLKRQRGVKDSGKLLPGHGGVLDRIDGITAALPVFIIVLFGMGLL